MSLEKIVRPFQQSPVFTSRLLIPAVQHSGFAVSTDVCILTWTGPNAGQYNSIPSDLALIGFKVDWGEDKSKRVTQTVRVTNPDDPDQYVMVERIKSTTLYNSQTGQGFNLQFADWDDDAVQTE